MYFLNKKKDLNYFIDQRLFIFDIYINNEFKSIIVVGLLQEEQLK